MKRLLTETEAAKQMRCSRVTLYRLRRAGKIHHYRKLGTLIRYKPEDIEANLEELAAYRPKPRVNNVTVARFG